MLLFALLLAPCSLFAQSLTVNAPFDPAHYQPLDGPQRFHRWMMEDGGSAAIHVQSLTSATYLQFIADPSAWNRSAGGFARRLGSGYGANLIQNSVHESLAAAAGSDPRYFACACSGFFHRSGYALKMTFLTHARSGRLTLDLPQLAGIYSSSMAEAGWWPHHYSALTQGVQTGHIQVGLTGAIHLTQEFSPEFKRLVRWPKAGNKGIGNKGTGNRGTGGAGGVQ